MTGIGGRPSRRGFLGSAAALLCGTALAAEPAPSSRAQLLHDGESALARGDTAGATASFERAAAMLHAADTEMALVRAAMQAGAYRQALAFCAHTAGAHHDAADASALYAWLLQAGGQGAYAARVLDEAGVLAPDDEVLAEARRQLQSAAPRATPLLLQLPHRIAPRAVMLGGQPAIDAGAVTAGSGVLVDAGRRALVPLSAVRQATGLWPRNGLGLTTRAEVETADETLGLALLRLAVPLDPGPVADGLRMAARDPFPGSPGFAVEFHAGAQADPGWPWLQLGFLGSPQGASGARRLGITLPPGEPRGGPVFDAAGRLAGIVVAGGDGADRWLPPSLLHGALGEPIGIAAAAPEPAGPSARLQPDEVYERSLRVALQLITMR